MAYLYNNILLCGFRATGKSTIAKNLAPKLGWEYIEMDAEIIKKAGKPISGITENGTNWQYFRELESSLLISLLEKKYCVISAGGGVGVNHHINIKTSETFGSLQLRLIQQAQQTLKTVITAEPSVIRQRLYEEEMKKETIQRPVLNEEKAKVLEDELKSITSPLERKEKIINTIIEDSLQMYRQREELYNQISSFTVDTGELSIENAVMHIYNKLTGKV